VDGAHAGLSNLDLSRVGLFPLPNVVLFPAQLLALHVFEPRYRRLIRDVIARQLILAVPRLRPGFDTAYYGAPPVFELCGVGEISEYSELPDGCFNIVVRGLGRVRLLEELRSQPYRVARAEVPAEVPADAGVAKALRSELIKQSPKGRTASGRAPLSSWKRVANADVGASADIVAGALIEDPDLRQQLLEELDPCRRSSWLIAHLHARALELVRLSLRRRAGTEARSVPLPRRARRQRAARRRPSMSRPRERRTLSTHCAVPEARGQRPRGLARSARERLRARGH
jgi:Lon protease-like protein